MSFNIFGIGKNNSSINDTKGNTNEKRFGIKKGDKIGPLNKDILTFSSLTPEQELEQQTARLAENSRSTKEIFTSSLSKIVKRGTEEDPQLLIKRIDLLKKLDKSDAELLEELIFLEFCNNQNTSFLLDKIEEIKKVFEEKQVSSRSFYANQREVLNVLVPENYETFLDCAKNEELIGEDFAALVMYKAKPHKIELGNETVKVDSNEIISLISGQQSISTVRENSYKKFEETVNSLIAKDYEKSEQQYYYKIVEGILSQKPELAQIAVDYNNYASIYAKKDLSNEEYYNAMENYFIKLEKEGILPPEIELKSIVPDENALINPEMTLKLFLQGKTVSQSI